MGSRHPPDPAFVLRGVRDSVTSLNFSPPQTKDEKIKYLASGTQSGRVSIWNLKVRNNLNFSV